MAKKYLTDIINDADLSIDGLVLVVQAKDFPFPHFERGSYGFKVTKSGEDYGVYPLETENDKQVPAKDPIIQTQGDTIFFSGRSDTAPNLDDIQVAAKIESYENKAVQVLQAFRAWAEREFSMGSYNIIMTDWESIETTDATGIDIQPATGSVEVGKTLQLTSSVQPDGATASIRFTSSDNDTATVDDKGLVTGVKAGEATITATDDSGKLTATSTITVTAPANTGA